MKRYIAHIKLEIVSESIESAQVLAELAAGAMNKKKRTVYYPDVGLAELKGASVTRFRAKPAAPRSRKKK